jgi:hypothetical protein
MRWVSLLFLLLLFPVLVWAEPVICGDATKLQYFQPSVDPTRAAPCPAPYAQFVLTETNPGLEVIEAQKTLYATIPQQHLEYRSAVQHDLQQPYTPTNYGLLERARGEAIAAASHHCHARHSHCGTHCWASQDRYSGGTGRARGPHDHVY